MSEVHVQQRLFVAASLVGWVLMASSCRSPNPENSSGDSPDAAAARPGELAPAKDPTATPVPTAAKEKEASSPTIDLGISPSTKRSAAGLPEPLPDYASWSLRKAVPPAKVEGASPHLAQRQAYAYLPPGKLENPPQASGAILLLEEKNQGTDFIAQISTIEKTETGWKPTLLARSSATEPFAVLETSRCGACHK